mmetsp:Transcript_56695/g.175822  ORF Transcript_56695/g.175822 Transcript_56695/m.175822 type:complete len:181 (+) Transcript_56695:104-646(+)
MFTGADNLTDSDVSAAESTGERTRVANGDRAAKVAAALLVLIGATLGAAFWVTRPRAPMTSTPVEAASHRPAFLSAVSDKAIQSDVGFDCNLGYTHWRQGWSYDKKQYCCLHTAKGCQLNILFLPVFFGVLGGIMLLALIAFLVWVGIRSRRDSKTMMKWSSTSGDNKSCGSCTGRCCPG